MFVLANRPGFPFLGNDFYREIGDVFSGCGAQQQRRLTIGLQSDRRMT